MRAPTLVILALASLLGKVDAQIPNNGFETWRTVNLAMEPTSWYSTYSIFDSGGSYSPVTRSTDHYPTSVGSYSVRIANDTALWKSGPAPGNFLGWGFLSSAPANDRPLFPLQGHPLTLRGYYRFVPENDDTMNIKVFLYKDGAEIAWGEFQSTAVQSTWTSFTVTISTYASADSCRLTFAAANEPKEGKTGPRGNSVLYIDNVSFDNLIVAGAGDAGAAVPSALELHQNYPNPFNPQTTIAYSLPKESSVLLVICDSRGREIRELASGRQAPGSHSVVWDGRTETGEKVASGVYYYSLLLNGKAMIVRKALLLK